MPIQIQEGDYTEGNTVAEADKLHPEAALHHLRYALYRRSRSHIASRWSLGRLLWETLPVVLRIKLEQEAGINLSLEEDEARVQMLYLTHCVSVNGGRNFRG